jgi:hypothetical protein
MLAMEERWEASGHTDSSCLRRALILCGTTEPLPSWVLSGLLELDLFKPEPMRPDEWRHMMVRRALVLGFSREEAFEKVSELSQETPAPCGPDMVQTSYQRIERTQPPNAKAFSRRGKKRLPPPTG